MNPQRIVPFIKIRIYGRKYISLKWYRNYLAYDSKYIIEKLEEYWEKYRFLNEIRSIVNFNNKIILDVGCGYTSILNLIPSGNRYGIDIVINGLKKENFPLDPAITWINGRAEKLPFDDNYFDIIFCTNGIDHYENPTKAISEIKRASKDEAFLILTVEIFPHDGKRGIRHPHTFTEDKILKLIEGYDILFKRYSPIKPQFINLVSGFIEPSSSKEMVLVLRKNNQR